MGLLGCLQSSQQRFLRSASGGRLFDINNSLYTSGGSYFDLDKKVVLKVDLCQVHKYSELQESFVKAQIQVQLDISVPQGSKNRPVLCHPALRLGPGTPL